LKKYDQLKVTNVENLDPILNKTAGFKFHNKSQFDFDKLIADPNNIASNLRNYINGFSEDAREIIEQFEFENQINKMDDANLVVHGGEAVPRNRSCIQTVFQVWKWAICLRN
jgi:type I restriction enzyme M protein